MSNVDLNRSIHGMEAELTRLKTVRIVWSRNEIMNKLKSINTLEKLLSDMYMYRAIYFKA